MEKRCIYCGQPITKKPAAVWLKREKKKSSAVVWTVITKRPDLLNGIKRQGSKHMSLLEYVLLLI